MRQRENEISKEGEERDPEKGQKEGRQDFTRGSVLSNIIRLAIPMTFAQLINVLYNIVDRIFIGRIPEHATLSLTGLGVCFPLITIVIAFANLVGMGGAPLFSIERGRGHEEEAERILGNSFVLLLILGITLTVLGYIFKTPLLWLLGASSQTIGYAQGYMNIYLIGSTFVMISLGLNSFINAQGFGNMGMATVAIGAVMNLILDPVFIFVMHMGVQGAALATIISQFAAACWTFRFLTGKRTIIRLRKRAMKLAADRVRRILVLGLAGFTMSLTNSLVQMVNNAALQTWGGDIYVAVITVINSIREVVQMPIQGITNSAQPVMSFNYGAGRYDRVRECIRIMAFMGIVYLLAIWGLISLFPEFWIRIFNHDPELIRAGVPAMHIYFFGYVFMGLQFSGQAVFQALGYARYAIFFSIFRKVVIVIPLILLLPGLGFGAHGVFMAEPISNLVGGGACIITMLRTVYFGKLKAAEDKSS